MKDTSSSIVSVATSSAHDGEEKMALQRTATGTFDLL
jgi:hypothetical protein